MIQRTTGESFISLRKPDNRMVAAPGDLWYRA
jgi:hypothetical protein